MKFGRAAAIRCRRFRDIAGGKIRAGLVDDAGSPRGQQPHSRTTCLPEHLWRGRRSGRAAILLGIRPKLVVNFRAAPAGGAGVQRDRGGTNAQEDVLARVGGGDRAGARGRAGTRADRQGRHGQHLFRPQCQYRRVHGTRHAALYEAARKGPAARREDRFAGARRQRRQSRAREAGGAGSDRAGQGAALAGVIFTPNALAIAPLTIQAKVPLLISNAGTSIITTKSPYIARFSFTLWQSSYPFGQWAAKRFKRAYTMVTDYAPGHDAEDAFSKSFKEGGGTIVNSVRVPLMNPDFAAYMQRVKDSKPDALFVFVPAGKT